MMNNYFLVGVLAAAMLSTDVSGQTVLSPGTKTKNTVRVAEKGAPAVRIRHNSERPAPRGGIANDACADAISLTVNAPADCPANATAGDNSGAAGDGEPTCDTGASAYEDVWYAFNSGSFTNVVINVTPGTIEDLVIDVLEGGCAGTSVACNFGTAALALSVPVTPNTDYVFSVVSNNDFGIGGTFDLCLTGLGGGTAPANDDCAGATSLTVGTECTPVTASIADATSTLPSIACNGFTSPGALDIWFSFVANGPITLVRAEGQGTMDVVMEGFTGDCNNLVSVGCADATFPPDGLQETLTMNTVAGTTYYVRVYHYGAGPTTDPEFNICAFTPSNVPANDECDSVTPNALATGGSITWTGDNTNGLDTEGLGFPNVWHAFTITECANVVLDYCGTTPAFGNASLRLYRDCTLADFQGSSSFDLTTCPDGNVTIFYNALEAGTYYYPVIAGTGFSGPYTVNVSAEACAPAPANNDCDNAQGLFVYTTCTPTDGTTESSTESLPAETCSGFLSETALDVWYQFTATGTDHTVTLTGTNGADLILQVFSGNCGGTTSLGCSDATTGDGVEELLLEGLTVGATYYIRAYHWDAAGTGATGTFNICVTGDIETSVADLSVNSAFTVFPNPSNGDLTISSKELSGASVIEVLDMTGRVLHSENRTLAAGQAHQLNLAGRIASGSYIVRLLTAEGSSEQRVVIR